MARKPYADTRLARYLAKRVMELKPRKTQAMIAAEAGFLSPNFITMIKQGANRLPIDRVPSLARALECDAAWLLRLALEQDVGRTAAEAINAVTEVISTNERHWLSALREASDDTDPRLTRRSRDALFAIFKR